MARQIADRDLAPLLEAARRWIDACLLEDGSLFAPGRALWTAANAEILQRDFVDRPDPGGGDFMTKLKRQLESAGAPAQQFAAELRLALLLFPSNIGAKVKRDIDMPFDAQCRRDPFRGVQLHLVALAVIHRQRQQPEPLFARDRAGGHRIETAREQDDGKRRIPGHGRGR